MPQPPLQLVLFSFLALVVGWTFWNLSLDAWWEPTDPATVEKILELARIKPDEVLYDLGCGDGRIVIAGAKEYKAFGVGVEIDPVRFLVSKVKAFLSGAGDRVEIRLGNIYETDLSDADVVVLFLSKSANAKLSTKLREELKPGARIISYYHLLPDWEPAETATGSDGHNIFRYEKSQDSPRGKNLESTKISDQKFI